MEEKWKQIPGFSKYEVSTFGQVRNIKTGRIHKQSLKNSGYYNIRLYDDNGECRNL